MRAPPQFSDETIRAALARHDGNVTRAADEIGATVDMVRRRAIKLDLPRRSVGRPTHTEPSARMREIAALVGGGLQKAVADRLGLAPQTVSYAVQKVRAWEAEKGKGT